MAQLLSRWKSNFCFNKEREPNPSIPSEYHRSVQYFAAAAKLPSAQGLTQLWFYSSHLSALPGSVGGVAAPEG